MDNDYNKLIQEKKQEIETMQLMVVQETILQSGFNPGEIQSSIFKALDISVPMAKPAIRVSKNIFDNRRSSANAGAIEMQNPISRNKEQVQRADQELNANL